VGGGSIWYGHLKEHLILNKKHISHVPIRGHLRGVLDRAMIDKSFGAKNAKSGQTLQRLYLLGPKVFQLFVLLIWTAVPNFSPIGLRVWPTLRFKCHLRTELNRYLRSRFRRFERLSVGRFVWNFKHWNYMS